MGFCIYNNVAVGAHYLINKYKLSKIAMLGKMSKHVQKVLKIKKYGN